MDNVLAPLYPSPQSGRGVKRWLLANAAPIMLKCGVSNCCVWLQHTHTHTHVDATHTAGATLFIIYPDCLLTFTPSHKYILYYLNFLVPLNIDSVLVLFVYSLIVFVLPFPFLFSKYVFIFNSTLLEMGLWVTISLYFKSTSVVFDPCDRYNFILVWFTWLQ